MNPKQLYLVLVALVLCCASAVAEGIVAAQADTITVAPYTAIEITAAIDVGDAEAIVFWQLAEGVDYREVGDGLTIHCWAPPGTYPIVAAAMVIDWDARKVRKVQYRCLLTVEGKVDPPDPPDHVKLRVTIVEESAERTPSQSTLYKSNALLSYLSAGDHEFAIIDDDVVDENDATPAGVADVLTAAKGQALPCVVVEAASGGVLWTGPLPETVDALIATLKQWGGA